MKFWILKFMHRPGFEPSIFRTKVVDANCHTMKAGLLHSILEFISPFSIRLILALPFIEHY